MSLDPGVAKAVEHWVPWGDFTGICQAMPGPHERSNPPSRYRLERIARVEAFAQLLPIPESLVGGAQIGPRDERL